jgi:hypothetical protein
VRDIIAEFGDFPALDISFSQPTSSPAVGSSFALLRALHFDPPLLGQAEGSWLNATFLRINVTNDYLEEVLARHRNGKAVTISVRNRLADDYLPPGKCCHWLQW